MKQKLYIRILAASLVFQACGDDNTGTEPEVPKPAPLQLATLKVAGVSSGFDYTLQENQPEIEIKFSADIDRETVSSAVKWTDKNSKTIEWNVSFQNGDSVMVIKPKSPLDWLSKYAFSVSNALKSKSGGSLRFPINVNLTTWIDMTDKFPQIPDEELLDLVQKQTFKYFWDFGHPVSGMARERTTSGDVVTTGGTGFGVMAMIAAAERGFITRSQALERIQKIVAFLSEKCTAYHGAFSHWINGSTGATQPFSTYDNGADLVETALLFQGLLTARSYFDANSADETTLRNDVTALWEAIEWTWFQKDGENALYWHWSPDFGWQMNMKISGWNEALIVYVLAAASPTHPVSGEVYEQGWTRNGAFVNGKNYYNYTLPLGGDYGGPLFFSHYSFLGLNPDGLSDQYTDYWMQNRNHTLINYAYCIANPKGYTGYSDQCWGLTACDGNNGYNAFSPTNDLGVIAPTAAISSMPYTPEESMRALRFFYYKLGDKLWSNYGFYDAFNLSAQWFDNQHIAIDQGPIVIMIENYRSGLLWSLFMSDPEIKNGLEKLHLTPAPLHKRGDE